MMRCSHILNQPNDCYIKGRIILLQHEKSEFSTVLAHFTKTEPKKNEMGQKKMRQKNEPQKNEMSQKK